MKLKNKAVDFFNSLKWVLFVSRRFSLVDRKGSSKVNSVLASLGICFGVMTLITVISVMNGFQMKGIVTGFDNFVVVLSSEGKQQMIYKHAISTLVPLQPVRFPVA